VAVVMGRIQACHQKLWASTQAGNAGLAAFYLHEGEEAMEELMEAAVVDDGVDGSAQMRLFGLPSLERLERKLRDEGVAAVHGAHEDLVVSCNGCHNACGYPFIRIKVPVAVDFPNHDPTVRASTP
jgi:hypothetical protein